MAGGGSDLPTFQAYVGDEEELGAAGFNAGQVFQMFQQLTQNSQATSAAVQAVQHMQNFLASSPGVGSGGSRPEDVTKVLKQPAIFDHERRDDPTKHWPEWAFQMRLWLGYLDPLYMTDLTDVESHPDRIPDLASMDAPMRLRATKLYAILATYVRGPTLKIIRSVELHNGLACWGALISHLEPRSRQRALALLEGLTSFHFGKRTITEGIYEFERLVQEYELAAGSGTRFNEELKIATLLRNAPNSVKSSCSLHWGQEQLIPDSAIY